MRIEYETLPIYGIADTTIFRNGRAIVRVLAAPKSEDGFWQVQAYIPKQRSHPEGGWTDPRRRKITHFVKINPEADFDTLYRELHTARAGFYDAERALLTSYEKRVTALAEASFLAEKAE